MPQTANGRQSCGQATGMLSRGTPRLALTHLPPLREERTETLQICMTRATWSICSRGRYIRSRQAGCFSAPATTKGIQPSSAKRKSRAAMAGIIIIHTEMVAPIWVMTLRGTVRINCLRCILRRLATGTTKLIPTCPGQCLSGGTSRGLKSVLSR